MSGSGTRTFITAKEQNIVETERQANAQFVKITCFQNKMFRLVMDCFMNLYLQIVPAVWCFVSRASTLKSLHPKLQRLV